MFPFKPVYATKQPNPTNRRRSSYGRTSPAPAATTSATSFRCSVASNFIGEMVFDASSTPFVRRIITIKLFVAAVSISSFCLYRAVDSIGFSLPSVFVPSPYLFRFPADAVVDPNAPSVNSLQSMKKVKPEQYDVGNSLERILKDASMQDRTVIFTTLNEAWASPNSVFDLFLESFRIGDHTSKLLNHLVVIALDQKAYSRCLDVHTHCFSLVVEGSDFSQEADFMTPEYLEMMWKRIDFLRSVLEMGYNFVFTDADVMWFRNPFPHFNSDADFQIACDHYNGNSSDVNNIPNGGFNFVRANNRSIAFYKFWYSSREKHPGLHDQDVLNRIKSNPFLKDIGLKMRFMSTTFFGGFCEPSKNLNKVCTMHANCCFGLENKLLDLRLMIEDWKMFMSLPRKVKKSQGLNWRVFQNCRISFLRHFGQLGDEKRFG